MSMRRLKVKAMDAALVAGVRIGNVAAFCREHEVSTRTFYRHRARVAAEGHWSERSRRPRHSPAMTGAELDAWICKLRADLVPDNGAEFIRDRLKQIAADTSPAWQVPSRSTINRVLDRRNLLQRNPKKRPRSSWRRFAYARPRDCYQIDATEVRLAGDSTVVVFDVLDDCTRLLVACHAAPAQTTTAAITAITTAFTTHGVPAIVLCDNGAVFTHRLIKPGLTQSRFTQTVTTAGARVIHSSPYHPQTCGKVERHHQTLKRWLRQQPPPATLTGLQQLLDTYREHYNTRRAHSAIGRQTPHQAWANAPSHGSPTTPPAQTDAIVTHPTASKYGQIGAGGQRFSVGVHRHGQTLTVIRTNHHIVVYDPDGQPLGHGTLTPGKNYLTLTPA
jgi:transposase InsO family protein